MKIMTGGLRTFLEKCLSDIKPNEDSCRRFLEKSLGLVTALNPIIGYARAAEVAKEAQVSGRSIKEIILEKGYLTEDQMAEILDPGPLTEPGIPKK